MRWKPTGQHVQQEPAHELLGGKRHRLHGAVPSRWPGSPSSGSAPRARPSRDEPPVGDRHPVGVARQVGQHRRRTGERALGVDHPLAGCRRGASQSAERDRHRPRPRELAEAPQLVCAHAPSRSSSGEATPEQRRDSTRTGRKKPRRQATQCARRPGRCPPPGTMPCTWGWWVMADPQVCSTRVAPIRAPRCLGSAAIVASGSRPPPRTAGR
jgi:hypothetical protein